MGINNPAAENVLGTLGAVLWSIQLIPQILKSHRDKSTEGLSTHLVAAWATSGIWLGSYNITQQLGVPLIVQPQAFTLLCTVSWAQCLYYGGGWSKSAAIGGALAFCCISAGMQFGLVYGARAGLRHGTTAPITLIGVLAAVFILGGILPQYFEVYKFKAVIGISLLFLLVDLMGGLVSCLSLVFQPGFDILASVSYGGIVVLELGIFALAAILNPRMKKRAKARRDNGEEVGGLAALALEERRMRND